jgi:phospholipid/cholesterol/gamma-HCH transport system substrate-binding protein
MPPDPRASSRRNLRVGALLFTALTVVVVATFLIGQEDHWFGRKNRYFIRFENVGGLSASSQVQLNGVVVGSVRDVVLPEDAGEDQITVWIDIQRRYGRRVRKDSAARIKTLGLLGDKYIAINSGSPAFDEIATGSEIPTAEATGVDQLIASGEDVMANVASISHSLSNILGRMDRGEGVLGALTVKSDAGEELRTTLSSTLVAFRAIIEQVQHGRGTVGRLVYDANMADQLAATFARLDTLTTELESGPGLIPALLHDPESKARFDRTLEGLAKTATRLADVAEELRDGKGLLPRLLNDPAYAQEVGDDLKRLVQNLNIVADRLTKGDGTVAQLINDPSVYEAIQDIVVGIDESKMLRWLLRNRQKAGIEKRYDAEKALAPADGEPR